MGEEREHSHGPIEGYHSITRAHIISGLAGIIDDLGLPHPLHLHCNNLGVPGNVSTTLETMKVLDGHRAHMAHLQFHAYGGQDWGSMRSEAVAIAEAFNAQTTLTCDAGAVLFGDAVTITADGPWQHLLHELTGRKWGNLDVENETGCGIVPYVYSDRHIVNAVQWAVGLELLLLINDPWRVFLTTDHPNGGCFWRYPEIIQLLMDVDYRKEQIKKLHPEAQKRTSLADLDRQYTLFEVAIITSAGPARALGLSQKGHLGVGADADVSIYPEKPNNEGVLFSYPRYVLKGGEVVVEEGEVRATSEGREFIVRPSYDEQIEEYIRPLFDKSTRCPSKTIQSRASACAVLNHDLQVTKASEPPDTPDPQRKPSVHSKQRSSRQTRWRRSPMTRSVRSGLSGKEGCRGHFFAVEGEAQR